MKQRSYAIWALVAAVIIALVAAAGLAPIDGQSGSGFSRFLGRFHILVLHFPITLLILALLATLVSYVFKGERYRDALGPLSLLAALSALVTVGLGLMLAANEGHSGPLVEQHMRRGVSVAIVTLIACGFYFTTARSQLMRLGHGVTLALATGLMFLTAHDGGSLVHGEDYLTAHAPEPIKAVFAPKPEKALAETDLDVPLIQANSETQDLFHASIEPLMQTTCSRCHGPGKQQAGLRFDTFDPALPNEHHIVTAKRVRDALNSYHMPPKTAKQPTEAERLEIVAWLDQALGDVALAQKAHGAPPPIRRQTVAEYNNTLSDLFETDADFGKILPPDPIAETGFSRDASTLSLSAIQLEFYLKIARKAVDRYVQLESQSETPKYFFREMEDAHIGDERQARMDKGAQILTKAEFERQRIRPADYKAEFGRELTPFPLRKDLEHSNQLKHRYMYRDMMPIIMHSPKLDGSYIPGEVTVRVHAAATQGRDGSWPRMRVTLAPMKCRTCDEYAIGEVDVTAPKSNPQIFEFHTHIDDLTVLPEHEIEYYHLLNSIPIIGLANVSRHEKALNSVLSGRASDDKHPKRHERWAREKQNREIMAELGLNGLHIDAIEMEYMPLGSDGTAVRWSLATDQFAESDTRPDALETFLYDFIEAAFRRPARKSDVDAYLDIYSQMLAQGAAPKVAARDTLATVLIAPDFLMIGTPELRENDFALASKLSYFLWNSAPDEELYEIAANGKLSDKTVLAEQTQRMLKDARTARFIRDFPAQWLRLDLFTQVVVMEEYYPNYDEQLASDMREETFSLFKEIFENGLDARKLIKPDFAMLNSRLAKHYGVENIVGGNFRRVPSQQSQGRGGLLRQASFLTINGDGIDSHPIRRGVWVKERLLASPPPPPPPDLDTDLSDNPELFGLPLRDKLEMHRDQPACAACHAKIDPWGIALENFDATGQWRTESQVDYGKNAKMFAVNAQTTLPSGVALNGVEDLEAYLVSEPDEQFTKSIVHHMLNYALGRKLSLADEMEIEALHDQFAEADFDMRALVVAIALSDAFER